MAKMVERVTTTMKNPKNIRNIAICAHIDHGKTTFSDNLLAGAGMMSSDLAGDARQLDFHDDEQERGITIDSAAVSMVHKYKDEDYLINLIDTPGHVDFGGDVTRAMRAVDGTIVVACAVEGVMPQTETVLKQALRERVKPILFINKVDRLIKELQLSPEQMQAKFVKIINQVNKMIDDLSPKELKGKWNVKVEDGTVCFGSAFHNWGMSMPYMKENEVNFKDIYDAYEPGGDYNELAKKAPVHEVVLNAVIAHLPNPVDAQQYRIPKIWHGDSESEFGKSLAKADPNGPVAFVMTKIVVDPQAGEVAAGRLFSGTIKKGQRVHLNVGKQDSRIQQVFVYNGEKREIVDNVPAGNIIGIVGPKAYPGETITEEKQEPFEAITHIFDPVVTKAIEAKNPADLPKLVEVLQQVSKEDPSIKVEINEETGEHLLSGMGELHLEVLENRILQEKNVQVQSSPPIVVYREAIESSTPSPFEGKSPNKHNKLYFVVEPLPKEIMDAIKSGELYEGRVKKKDLELRDKLVSLGMDTKEADKVKDIHNGNIFVEKTRGEVHIGEIIEMVLDMFEDVMNSAPLAGEPGLGMKVSLVDTKLHEDAIHRGPAQLYPAVREGIRGAIKQAKPKLLEPVQTLRFEAPEEHMGEISKLISNKRGQLLDMQQEGKLTVVRGKLPVAEMFGLTSELRSATGGRGSSSLVDQIFEKLPEELQEKVISRIRNRKGMKQEDEESE
ncbi:MAG: elongation factor EF-2 [Nanobdellota archaeon]